MESDRFLFRHHIDEDIPAILAVIKTAFAEQAGAVDPPSSAESKTIEIVKKELELANAIVVEYESEIIACIFYRSIGTSIYFDRLAVLSEFRRNGIAKTLVEDVENIGRETGHRNAELSVRIELETLQKYYESLNYEAVEWKSHRGYERPTYVVMKKQLNKT